jgi:hypothetical protein
LDRTEFQALFERFTHSAFRLETHQTYTMPAESENLARFLRGEPKPEGHNKRWQDSLRAYRAAGKALTRVKVVQRPLSDYTRFLLAWAIPGNVEAGEDYRILDITDRELHLPDQDFWLFDNQTVALLNFSPDGTVHDRELVDDLEVPQYRRWRDLALAESVPFSEYRT